MAETKTNSPVPEPPSQEEIGRALRLIEPIRKVINPKVYGIDNVPQTLAHDQHWWTPWRFWRNGRHAHGH